MFLAEAPGGTGPPWMRITTGRDAPGVASAGR